MRAHIAGDSVRATNPEMMTAPASVSANSMNRRSVRPVAKPKGAKTAASVSVMATTAKPISRTPLKAARSGGSPSSIWRWMFSSTTMASSTTSPIASTTASSVSVLMEKPMAYMSAQLPISETGIVTRGITVARSERRNRKMTAITSTIASPMAVKTSSIERAMKVEES